MNYPTEVVDPSKLEDIVMRYLTPSMVEQQKLISKGECPHNQGFSYGGHGHNSDCYECNVCGKYFWY